MARVILSKLTKRFDDFVAVNNFDLVVEDGEFLTLLGPSGCGKTTTLRMVAGFIVPEEGSIVVGDHVVSDPAKGIFVQPEERRLGMVFQSYAVWPHMTLAENVEYPLKIRKVPKSKRNERVASVLDQVRLSGMGKRYPHALSGGQQQRVALARALIMDPEVMLLDEPLSNLDAKLRADMRFEIQDLQKRTGITILYVTHDQAEAMAMSDRIVVMNEGVIQQIGGARDVYERPANTFVAGFIGLTNFIPCVMEDGRTIRSIGVTGDVTMSIRPEDITIGPMSEDSEISGYVRRVTFLGNVVDYRVEINGVTVRVEAKKTEFREGDHVSLTFDQERTILF